jgi:hypothetical protein
MKPPYSRDVEAGEDRNETIGGGSGFGHPRPLEDRIEHGRHACATIRGPAVRNGDNGGASRRWVKRS